MSSSVTELYELMNDLPAGAWVAISTKQHRVMAYGEDAEAVVAESKQKGEEHPLITRVPDPDAVMFF